jgi:hypothetical protein
VVVAAVVMLNILELIMEIVPNFPTEKTNRKCMCKTNVCENIVILRIEVFDLNENKKYMNSKGHNQIKVKTNAKVSMLLMNFS